MNDGEGPPKKLFQIRGAGFQPAGQRQAGSLPHESFEIVLTKRGNAIRWLVWGGFAVLWSVALLTTFPVRARDAILPEEYAFSSGKILHVAAYAVFALLTAWLDVRRPWRWALLAVLSLHAGATEFFQQFVGRTSSLADVGLDHAGLVLGVALSWWRWLGVTRFRPRP